MASVTYGKCYLWQKYYVKCNYGKNTMANETEPLYGYIFIFSRAEKNNYLKESVWLDKGVELRMQFCK